MELHTILESETWQETDSESPPAPEPPSKLHNKATTDLAHLLRQLFRYALYISLGFNVPTK